MNRVGTLFKPSKRASVKVAVLLVVVVSLRVLPLLFSRVGASDAVEGLYPPEVFAD